VLSVESKPGYLGDFAERRRELRFAGVTRPRAHRRNNCLLCVQAGADDEREAEPGLIGLVEVLNLRRLARGEPVETGRGLLPGGRRGELASPGEAPRQVGVRPDQGQLPLSRRAQHRFAERPVKPVQVAERPLGVCFIRHPGRMLKQIAKGSYERAAVA
jgi:hypothetical protein